MKSIKNKLKKFKQYVIIIVCNYMYVQQLQCLTNFKHSPKLIYYFYIHYFVILAMILSQMTIKYIILI